MPSNECIIQHRNTVSGEADLVAREFGLAAGESGRVVIVRGMLLERLVDFAKEYLLY